MQTIQMNWFARQKQRHRCREQTYGHHGGESRGGGRGGGGGGMNWAIGIDMYTLLCIKQITNKNLLYKNNKIKYKNKTNTLEKRKKSKIEKEIQSQSHPSGTLQ